jgi:hypothetical protein
MIRFRSGKETGDRKPETGDGRWENGKKEKEKVEKRTGILKKMYYFS